MPSRVGRVLETVQLGSIHDDGTVMFLLASTPYGDLSDAMLRQLILRVFPGEVVHDHVYVDRDAPNQVICLFRRNAVLRYNMARLRARRLKAALSAYKPWNPTLTEHRVGTMHAWGTMPSPLRLGQ